MGLIKNRKTDTETASENTTPADEPKVAAEAQTESQAKAEDKAVAVKQTAGAPAVFDPKKFWYSNPGIEALMADLQYGDFPSVTASQGSFKIGSDKADIGNIIEFKAIIAKSKLVCSPNSQDDESKEYFAAVYEGDTTMDGRSIEECLEDAKAAGYERADIKKYIDLVAYVTANSSDKNDIEDEIVLLQLSPMSVIEWNRFSKRLQADMAFGKVTFDEPPIIRAKAKAMVNKQKKEFTCFDFSLAPQA